MQIDLEAGLVVLHVREDGASIFDGPVEVPCVVCIVAREVHVVVLDSDLRQSHILMQLIEARCQVLNYRVVFSPLNEL